MDLKILIQGPIYENTPDIYENYKKNGLDVTVSSYSTSNISLLKFFDNNDLVINNPPTNMGIYNRNGQRVTTHFGLKKILSHNNNSFVLKTRSDHFFRKIIKSLYIFEKEILKYPINEEHQNYRMIIPNAGTTQTEQWGPYHLGDHWMFGQILDVYNYYTLENVNLSKDYQFEESFSPEPEFCIRWMYNKNITETFETLLAKRFIVLNNQDLDYDIVKNCIIFDCITDWDEWNSSDNGVITHNKWKEILKKNNL